MKLASRVERQPVRTPRGSELHFLVSQAEVAGLWVPGDVVGMGEGLGFEAEVVKLYWGTY